MLTPSGRRRGRRLRAALLAKDYDTWIAPLRAINWVERGAYGRGAEYLRARLGSLTTSGRRYARQSRRQLDSPARLKLRRQPRARGADTAAQDGASGGAEAKPPARQLIRGGIAIAPSTTFVVGESNQVAFEAARAVVERAGPAVQPALRLRRHRAGQDAPARRTANAEAGEHRRVDAVASST